MRGDVEEGSEGDRKVRGGREGGREKSSDCTLSFSGAKNFIPGKALFFLSLENSASAPLITAAVHTHGYFHTALCEDRHGILPPPRPARCCPSWAGPNSKHSHAWSRSEPTKSAAQGWPRSSLGGSGLARNARQWTRPNTHRLFLHSPPFLYLPPSLFTFPSFSHLISTRVIRPSLPPSARSCPTV